MSFVYLSIEVYSQECQSREANKGHHHLRHHTRDYSKTYSQYEHVHSKYRTHKLSDAPTFDNSRRSGRQGRLDRDGTKSNATGRCQI